MFLPIAIIALVFSFVLLIVKMSQDHELEKHRMSKGSDKSLTVSELNELVEAAVKEAISPLQARIRQLEAQEAPLAGEEQLQLEPASRRLNLDDVENDFSDDSVEDLVSSSRKRVR